MRKLLKHILLVILVIVVDQGSKSLALNFLTPFSGNLSPGVIFHCMPMNEAVVRSVFGFCVMSMFWMTRLNRPLLCMWTGAAISNLGEGISFGYVVDFLPVPIGSHILVGNVADLVLAFCPLIWICLLICGKAKMADIAPVCFTETDQN